MCSSSPVVLSCYSSLGRVHVCKTSDYSVHPGYLLVPCHTETTRFQIILSKLIQSKSKTFFFNFLGIKLTIIKQFPRTDIK